MRRWILFLGILCALGIAASAVGDGPVAVEGQPLAANSARVREALEAMGAPLPASILEALRKAEADRDSIRIQEILDALTLARVTINPETRVKVERGDGPAILQQGGYTPMLVKVVNLSTSTAPLRITSPQAGPVYAGMAELSAQRQRQPRLRENENVTGSRDRFLDVEMATAPPMLPRLSGLEVEYALALIYCSEAGRREATLGFNIGQGTQDLGFRGETPVLFQVRPAVKVLLRIRDHDGKSTTARLEFRDAAGRVHPPQAKRLAPDFFFQKQIYRHDGESVLLPPGELTMESSRGPEYRVQRRRVKIPSAGAVRLDIALDRWIDTEAAGYYSGDHHIHGAGCGHYTYPTEGVSPEDMFRNVKGEGLNVGCVLTWGPCFEFQRTFFSPGVDRISEPKTVMKYDVEVSGFGSQALGHVCLLNLRDQTYPGSEGTKSKGWPTWTTPVLRWAKAQGAVTGYAHAASGVHIDPAAAGKRLMERHDTDKDGWLSPAEAGEALLPEPFARADGDEDRRLSEAELAASHARAAEELPNLAIPEMNGVGAMEACVTVANGLCDFISSMDTARIQEWNTWYHLLNCGFPVKTSGETDFPCMSGTRVGQGRVYVSLGKVDRLDFTDWCEGLRSGRSYVSDGFAHALHFAVDGREAGGAVELAAPGEVQVTARVAFSAQTPLDVAQGTVQPAAGRRLVGDTVNKHEPLAEGTFAANGSRRKVELVVNGRAVASTEVPADGKLHNVHFRVRVDRSSWLALRQFPQLHTNPVNVRVAGAPIRASRESALWCIGVIDQLWRNRERAINPAERDEARRTFERTKLLYRKIAAEAP